jgi:hypothetical protein
MDKTKKGLSAIAIVFARIDSDKSRYRFEQTKGPQYNHNLFRTSGPEQTTRLPLWRKIKPP